MVVVVIADSGLSPREAHGKRRRRFPKEGHTAAQASRQLDDKCRSARAKEEKVSSVVNRLLTQWRAHLLSGIQQCHVVRWHQGAGGQADQE